EGRLLRMLVRDRFLLVQSRYGGIILGRLQPIFRYLGFLLSQLGLSKRGLQLFGPFAFFDNRRFVCNVSFGANRWLVEGRVLFGERSFTTAIFFEPLPLKLFVCLLRFPFLFDVGEQLASRYDKLAVRIFAYELRNGR